ncbi:MAG: 3-dehydroquinate dehydratase 1 [Candidatus Westeberhardia cardiocondylae]|nr:3-dehydroquinate dehydratase 1 [Candidatus Westeberhardia cardiocondylae]
MNKKFHILIINGPNLNLLGTREIDNYGIKSLEDIIKDLYILSNELNVKLSHFQSNAEYMLIDVIHNAKKKDVDFIIINPAAFTHTSISIRDALLAVNIPCIEVHISNIFSRESFRHISYISDIALGMICGFGHYGYFYALRMAVKKLLMSN